MTCATVHGSDDPLRSNTMTEAELIRRVLIEGAIGGAVLSLIAFLLSKFTKDIVGRTLLATVLFAAAGAYLGFAFQDSLLRPWVLIELLQCIAFGTLGYTVGVVQRSGSRSDGHCIRSGILLHYLDQDVVCAVDLRDRCISFDWVVAAYIFIYYRGASRRALSPER